MAQADTVEPEWVNDQAFDAGNRLVFAREVDSQADLFSIACDGADERRLTDTPDAWEDPVGITTIFSRKGHCPYLHAAGCKRTWDYVKPRTHLAGTTT